MPAYADEVYQEYVVDGDDLPGEMFRQARDDEIPEVENARQQADDCIEEHFGPLLDPAEAHVSARTCDHERYNGDNGMVEQPGGDIADVQALEVIQDKEQVGEHGQQDEGDDEGVEQIRPVGI